MKAVQVTRLDGPEYVRLQEVDLPMREPEQSLVRVHTVAPAFPDLLLSQGLYQIKPALPFSPGSDFAGVVVEPAPGSQLSVGQRVAGCLSFGAAAEFVCADTDRLYAIPDEMSFVDACALPMNYLTAHFALRTRGGLQAGDWVTVLGASGGVGLASIQIAAGLGAKVVAVVSDAERATVALKAGAHHAVLRETTPAEIRTITGGRGVDLVVDVVGGDMTDSLRSLAPAGRVLVVGFASGEIPTVKVNRLLLTNTDVRGVESAYLWDAGISGQAWDELMELWKAGWLRPLVRDGGDLTDYGHWLERLSDRSVVGRTVLTV